jgi:hypothetical protein
MMGRFLEHFHLYHLRFDFLLRNLKERVPAALEEFQNHYHVGYQMEC